ncbi:MAG: DUF983 domain-containing protein [Anaerolineae bacterium]
MFLANPEARRVLWWAFNLRCPHCGIGRTFSGLFKANELCAHCGVRFERHSGESVGGMYINLSIAETTTMGGFFLFNTLFHFPVVPHAIFWVLYNIAFVTYFYNRSRSLWVGVNYLTGGVYRDDDPRAQGEEEL